MLKDFYNSIENHNLVARPYSRRGIYARDYPPPTPKKKCQKY